MGYRCAYGCRTYNPNCDGCDSATTSNNPYRGKEESKELFEAAKKGMTREEWFDYRDEEE